MREILKEYLDCGHLVIHLDDILIHAATQEKHDKILAAVLKFRRQVLLPSRTKMKKKKNP